MGSYSDAAYGVKERHWFGLPKKHGGSAASGFTQNETETTQVTRFYPGGPIKLLKFGVLTLATAGKSEITHGLTKQGTRIKGVVSSTSSAPYVIASATANDDIDAGSYLTITSSTSACSTGSWAYFIEFRRLYDAKWNPIA